MSAIIVTGAGGFVGRRLVERLAARGGAVVGIGRGDAPANWPSAARWLKADLANATAYEAALAGAACVLHLAAVTGKASPAEYQRGNVEATRALLGACERAGVARFVFVSSIAAKFVDRRFYPYAESKIAAEALVVSSSIPSVIVRPTMILGPGSPIELSLGKLAGLPVSPMFGDGRRTVQPIDVDDVADALAALAQGADIGDGVIEIGGPDAYVLRDLYARLRTAHGKAGAPRLLHLPLGFFRHTLAAVEKPLLPLLPLTAGQLATFANDGVAAPHPGAKRLLPYPRRVPRAVGPTSPPAPRVSPPFAAPHPAKLQAEFSRNARYVADATPTPYQVSKYLDFHQRRGLAPTNAFDALLLNLSHTGGFGLALADSYSGLFRRQSIVRSKLVLALAILESSPPSFAMLDAPDSGRGFVWIRMAMRGAMAGLSTLFAAPFLLPLQLVLGRTGRQKPSR
ncbi:MAG: NAD(P)-dependent oxidoreductase [Hyphomonadaceae bacterium]